MNDTQLDMVKALREKTAISLAQCQRAITESNGDMDKAISLLKIWGSLKGAEKASQLALEGKVIAFANNFLKTAAIVEINCQTEACAKTDQFTDFCKEYVKSIVVDNEFGSHSIDDDRHLLIAKTGENVIIRRSDKMVAKNDDDIYYSSYNHTGDRLGVIVEFGISRSLSDNKEFQEFAQDVAMQVAAATPTVVVASEIPETVVSDQKTIVLAQLKAEGKPEASWDKIMPGKMAKWRSTIVLLEQECVQDNKKTIDQKRQEISKTIGGEVVIKRFVRYTLGEAS